MQSIKFNYEKLQNVYESKIKALSNKIENAESSINDNKGIIAIKDEQIKSLNNAMLNMKKQNKELLNEIALAKEEMFKYQQQYEKEINLKDNKILQLQNIVNQSLCSFNSGRGRTNIQLAQKLDNEVKELIRSAKENHNI